MEPTIEQLYNGLERQEKLIRAINNKLNLIAASVNMNADWITMDEAERISQLKRGTLRNLCSQGKIECRKRGKRRINLESLTNYLQSKAA